MYDLSLFDPFLAVIFISTFLQTITSYGWHKYFFLSLSIVFEEEEEILCIFYAIVGEEEEILCIFYAMQLWVG